jgi:hypothetical protein
VIAAVENGTNAGPSTVVADATSAQDDQLLC